MPTNGKLYVLPLTVAHKLPDLGADVTEFLPDSLTRSYDAVF
jgi:hypothetical protein